MLIAAARRAPPFREVSDGAVIEMYTLEALRGRLLVGPYSRFGWHHPGPMFFYLLAPWYWLSGLHTAGAQAGALVINVAAIAALGAALMRAASAPAAIITCAAVAAYIVRVGDMLVSVWNPHVIVLSLMAFVGVGAATGAAANRALVLWLVVLGTFLVQTHLAMAPVVAAVSIPVLLARRDLVTRNWRHVATAIIVLWLPVAIEQAMHRPGNLTRIVAFFVSGGDAPPVQSLGTAVRAWSSATTAAFRSGFVVAMGFDFDTVPGAMSIVVCALLCGLAICGSMIRRRNDFASWLAGLSGIATLVALAATTRIRGHIVDHEIFWMSALGVLDAAAIVAVLIERETGEFLKRPATAFVLAVTAAVGAIGMIHVDRRERGVEDHNVDVIADALSSYIRAERPRRVLVTIDPSMWPLAAGALLQLDKTGAEFAVDDRWPAMFGERFTRSGTEGAEVRVTGSAIQPAVVRIR